MTIVFVLTLYLIGNPVPVVWDNTFETYDQCKAEGFKQVRDYQEGGIRAIFDCDELPIFPPHCEADYCI